jgi:hypothetical protein
MILDAIRLVRDIKTKGFTIDLWGTLLNVPQLIGGLIFIMTVEGLAVFATAIVTLVIAGQIHKREPFSRLIGCCHLPWLALLPWLVYRLQNFEHSWLMKSWGWYVAATILISLAFDVLDVYRYARGERKYSWADK